MFICCSLQNSRATCTRHSYDNANETAFAPNGHDESRAPNHCFP